MANRRPTLPIILAAMLALGASGCDDCQRTASQCCKVCKEGKACGDSCIAPGATCHVSKGCACEGAPGR